MTTLPGLVPLFSRGLDVGFDRKWPNNRGLESGCFHAFSWLAVLLGEGNWQVWIFMGATLVDFATALLILRGLNPDGTRTAFPSGFSRFPSAAIWRCSPILNISTSAWKPSTHCAPVSAGAGRRGSPWRNCAAAGNQLFD